MFIKKLKLKNVLLLSMFEIVLHIFIETMMRFFRIEKKSIYLEWNILS